MSLEIDNAEAQIDVLQGMPAATRVAASFNMTPKQWVSLIRVSKRSVAAETFLRQFAVSREICESEEGIVE